MQMRAMLAGMSDRKNPAAVALGRLGGLVTGVAKGFAGMSAERREAAMAASLETRRANAKRRKLQASGRLGGQVTGVPKGFAGMSPERGSVARARSLETRRKKARAEG